MKEIKKFKLWNTPLLTLNDLLDVWEHPTRFPLAHERKRYSKSPLFNNFKKMAKSKL